MNKGEEPKMMECPYCPIKLPENDLRAQMIHMDEHPEMIAQRLREPLFKK